jgi:uncharacterized membrane protein
MTYQYDATLHRPALVLPLTGFKAYLFQILLMAATIVLPVASHLMGAPVRYFLPMHWPVILAALVFGWRGGALTGVMAPLVSFILSGLPLPMILPAMTLELLAYGLITGFLKEKLRLNGWLSAGIALVSGRIVFLVTAVIIKVPPAADVALFARNSLLPGIIAAVAQLVLLPLLAWLWVKNEKKKTENRP